MAIHRNPLAVNRHSRDTQTPAPPVTSADVTPRVVLIITRWVLPLMIVLVGGVLIAAGHGHANSPAAAAGVAMIIVALIVWMINWMFRMSVRSNEDRDKEEEAREYFDQHGRWPDE